METKKLVLLEQIKKEIKAGSTSTLVNVIHLLTEKQISDNYTQETKDYLESIKIYFEFKKGMTVRAKRDLKGKDTNWNSPSQVLIPEGTIFELDSAESNGDLFAILKEGTCTCNRRDGLPYLMQPSTHPRMSTHVILVEGKSSRHPYDFGLALKSAWEIINN
jgi:hypothetical protein